MNAEIRSLALGAVACLAALMYAHSAVAQVDLSGAWTSVSDQIAQNNGGAGPDLTDYMGIPLNNQGREHALLSWTPETVNQVNRQCEPWPMTYFLNGATGGKIWPSVNQDGFIIAWNIGGSGGDREPMTIWMPPSNVRAPSPQALDIPGGFTTGRWEGDTLVTVTTHIQDGYLTRNGVPLSDKAVVTMYLTRHGEMLTVTGVIQDPVYLAAPYVLVSQAVHDAHSNDITGPPNIGNVAQTCQPGEEVSTVLNGHVPNYVVESENPMLNYVTEHYHIPHEAVTGGPETIYPSYIKKIKGQYTIPKDYCGYYCCGGGGLASRAYDINVLKCKIGP